jgi:hypothetical protein
MGYLGGREVSPAGWSLDQPGGFGNRKKHRSRAAKEQTDSSPTKNLNYVSVVSVFAAGGKDIASMSSVPERNRSFAWGLALTGQFLAVFAAVALSGPGRIDIVDGQTRYEVARSLVEHGDSAIRDERVWFWVFPGRDGMRFTYYRFPQSVAGAAAIQLADATGPVSEGRRHFFFSLLGAVACALMTVSYSSVFRSFGHTPVVALAWSFAGIFCTPNWYYGTTCFDDILGTAASVLALSAALLGRQRFPILGAAVAGLSVGLALNCKEPLGIVVLPVLAALGTGPERRRAWLACGLVLAGTAAGGLAYLLYQRAKFPPSATAAHAEQIMRYLPGSWLGDPFAALLGWAISPGSGVWWYCPTLLLSLAGFAVWYQREKYFTAALALAAAVFVLFFAGFAYYKGDPAWGPRYLTPLFAWGWLLVPAGAARFSKPVVGCLLSLGLLVQLLGLSVDPHRLYVQLGAPSAIGAVKPWIYFDSRMSHLWNRPREICELLTNRDRRAETFSPAPEPTFTFPVIDPPYLPETGPAAIEKYHLLNSFRPWWISQQYLAPEERPVALGPTAALFGGGLLAGLALTIVAVRRLRVERAKVE